MENKKEKTGYLEIIMEHFELLEKNLDNWVSELPSPFKRISKPLLKGALSQIKEELKPRPPRFVIVGRRGAGKSSLINAIFGKKVAEVGAVKSTTGKGIWYDYKDEKGTMLILDTRGLGEGSQPSMESEKETAEEEIKASLEYKCPDAILFLCKAKEVDAHIDEDINFLLKIKSYIQEKHSYNPPIIGIITQVDELDPPYIDPPYEDEEKQKNIEAATKLLSQKLKAKFNDVITVIPTSAYMRFKNGEIDRDRRWNIDKLVECLIQHVPNSAKVELARISKIKSIQKQKARNIVATVATMAGVVGLLPIPGSDLPIITSAQIGMIMMIGYISGREMNENNAVEFLTVLGVNVGLGFVFREIARALIKLIPTGGNIISGGVAAAGTWAIGEAAIAYFIDEKSPEEVKQIYEHVKEKKLYELNK